MEANTPMPIQMSGEEEIGNSYYLAACDNIDMVTTDGFGQSGPLQQIVQIIPQSYDKRQLLVPQPPSPKYSVATTMADAVTFTQLDGNVTMPIVDGQLSLIESGGQQYLILPNIVTAPTQQIVLQDPPGNQPVVPVRFPEQQSDPLNIPRTLTQLTNLRTVSNDTSTIQTTFVSAGRQQTNVKPSQPATPQHAAPVFPQGKVLQFHDTVQKKTERVQSAKLDMLHIIPSLYKRTVLQESQADTPNACKYCSFRSDDQNELDKHYEQHRNEEISESPEGNQRKKKRGRHPTVKKKRTAQMIRTTVAVEPDPVELPCNCAVCDELLSTLKQYKKHMKAHANEKPHRCDECGESFNKERNLNLHKSLHTMLQADGDRAKYQCPECQRTFSRMAGLKMHITMHAEEETFICKECGDEFNLQSELTQHVAEHDNDIERHLHDKNKGISLLIQTESDFENGDGVADRSITVNIEDIPDDLSAIKPSLIQFSNGERVPSDGNSRKKVRLPKAVSDSGSGAHECTVCGKTFQRKSQLTRHNRIHTGEKPYTCTICGKAFNQKCAMQTHFISKHSEEKPFSCPYCPQRYVQRGNLKIHIDRVHTPTDEAAFSCTFCPCTFKRLGSLHAHLTKYHPNRDLTQQRDIGTFMKGPSKPATEPQEIDGSPQNYLRDILEFPKQDSVNGVQTQAEDIVHRALEACAMQNTPLQESSSTFDLVESDLGLPSEGLEVEKDASAILNIEEQMVVDACMGKTDIQESDMLTAQDALPPDPQPEIGGNVPPEVSVPLTTPVSLVLSPSIQPQPAVRSANEFSLLPPPAPMNVKSLSKLWKVRHVHGTRWHQCIYCPKEFRKPSDLVRHIRVHTLERPYKCRTCFKAFSVKSSLTTHVKTHLGIKPYKCQVCHKSFTTAGSLKVHLRMHTGLKPFHCPHCDKRFRTSGHRKAHLVSHTKKIATSQMTNIRKAPKKVSVDALQIPLQAPLIITEDGAVQQYRGKKDSTLSMGNNDPLRPFKCNQCGKAFKKSNHLKQHTRSHTGEKPYKCDQCKRSFISTGILKAHLKTHLGINAFRCQICSQAFSTNGSLKRHALTHSDTRPFMCPYCRKTFKSLVNCRKHIKTHRAELASIQQDGLGSSLQNLGRDMGHTLTGQSTISGLPTVEETLNSTYIGDFAEAQTMAESSIKEVDSNMVQGVENMSHVQADETQQQSIMLSQPMQQQVLSQDVQMQVQLNNAPLSLEDIEGLSLPVESNAQLLTQHEPVQINHGQAGFSLFGLDMTPQDGGNALPAADGHHLYTNTMSLLENLNAQPQPTVPLANIQISQTPHALVADHGQQAVNSVPAVKNATGRGSERRGKYYGAKQVTVNSRQMYQCTGCEGLFKPDEYVEHSRSFKKCVKELPHICEFCCHRFKEKTHHESHMRFHGVDSGVIYKCSKCGVGFIDKEVMEEHEQLHGDTSSEPALGKRKQCNINIETPGVPHAQSNIGRSNFFRLTDEQSRILSQTNPNLHMTVSERVLLSAVAEKDRVTDKVVQKRGRHKALEVDGYIHKNVCPMCPKSFRKKNDLVRHIRTHTGDRPFSCKQCGKSFAVKSCLFSHERTHSGVKSFRCHICNLMYAAKTSLKVHMRLHTGATPYKCPHCPLKFRTSGHRKNHMATHFTNRANKKKKNSVPSKKAKDNSKPQKSQQDSNASEPQANPIVISDLTFTLPDGVLQGLQAGDGLQLQWNGQTLQLVTTGSTSDGEQLAFQIDPSMLQQVTGASLQQPSQDDVRKYTQPDTSGPAPNLVIQPVSIQDRASAGPHTSTHEINVAVPASLAPLTQQLFQSTPAASNKRSDLPSNNDGLAVLQAIQQLCNNNTTISGGMHGADQEQRSQELLGHGIALVNQDGSENQDLMNTGSGQPFTFELLTPDDTQGTGSQRYAPFGDGALLTSSS